MTPELLERAVGCSPAVAQSWSPHIDETLKRYSVDSPVRISAFLAQVGHESCGLTAVEEGLRYSASSLVSMWPKRFTPEFARACAGNPEKIANVAYANRLGNGPADSGDGWRYRGRGLIQITGKENYAALSRALDHDFLETPADLALPQWAALSAGWFWDTRKLNAIADSGDFELLTRRINGGTNGLQDRITRWERAKAALGA